MNIRKMFKGGMPSSVPVDPELMTPEAKKLEKYLLKNIVGQDRAVRELVKAYEAYQAGIQDPGKPLTVLLFLGPTGSGKTRLMEIFCEYFWPTTPDMLIKIDCAEFTHSHEVSKILGSPPGYVGTEVKGRITKEKLESGWNEGPKFSVVLFDEIEKAHPEFHQLLLGVMDKGVLTTGKNQSIDLRNTFIIMTSNLGAKTVAKHLNSREIGLRPEGGSVAELNLDQDIYKTSMDAAKKFFEPEWLNRVDRVVVFRSLSEESIRSILEIELDRVQKRLKDTQKYILIACSKSAKDFIISEGISMEFGARALRRTIERFLVKKLSRIIATKQAVDGDMVQADYEKGEKHLKFGVLKGVVDVPPPQPKIEVVTPKDPVEGFYDRGNDNSKRGLYLFVVPKERCIFCGGILFHREFCPDYPNEGPGLRKLPRLPKGPEPEDDSPKSPPYVP